VVCVLQIENERLDLQHELVRYVYEGKLHFAPLSDPKMILDIGTGTGQWPIELGGLQCFGFPVPYHVIITWQLANCEIPDSG
jgi:hypothetical protein